MSEPILLTKYSHGGGCGCKISPAVLKQIIEQVAPGHHFPSLLVGNHSNDDAAVYELEFGECVISTTDFFMPIVNDAYDFGRIAAANSISDVYAMGGKPIMAIAVLGWPVEKLAPEVAAQVLQGGRSICAEANIPLAGGHSIDSPEPFFGLAVTGVVSKAQLKQNNTAQAGDQLFLTKPLGIGILTTAQKRGLLPTQLYNELLSWISKLNSIGTALAAISGVHAMTDVTGFGLMGHASEMAEGSALSATIYYNQLPVLAGVAELIQQGVGPDATTRNWNAYSANVQIEKTVNMLQAFKLLPDPQTNGGLLVSVAPHAVPQVQQVFQQHGLQAFSQPIGVMQQQADKLLYIK